MGNIRTQGPGVASLIPARSHTFAEIDHEIISTVILIASADSGRIVVSYKEKYVHEVLPWKNCLFVFVWFDSLRPINNLSVKQGQVFLGWTSTKLGLMCLVQGHKAVTPVRVEPAVPWSRVKHSTTEPLHSHIRVVCPFIDLSKV